MSDHGHDSDTDSDLYPFLASIDTQELCAIASSLRNGIASDIGDTIIGGFNVLYEIQFQDGISWMARCPMPHTYPSSETADILMESYAATLKYLKLRTSIPVPAVFEYHRKTEEANNVGASYILMERLPGHPINIQDMLEWDDEYQPARAAATKFYSQLADYVMQFSTLQFDKIGSLLERPVGSGSFCIGEYFDYSLIFPQARGNVYETFPNRGPFNTVTEFHSAVMDINEKYAAVNPNNDYKQSVKLSHLLRPQFTLPQFDHGPFIINHDELYRSNILVDDDYNITAILDFPGTTTSLTSLCNYPHIFGENCISPFTEREIWIESILNARSVPGSALIDVQLRRLLMEGAKDRGDFEFALLQANNYYVIAPLAKKYGIV